MIKFLPSSIQLQLACCSSSMAIPDKRMAFNPVRNGLPPGILWLIKCSLHFTNRHLLKVFEGKPNLFTPLWDKITVPLPMPNREYFASNRKSMTPVRLTKIFIQISFLEIYRQMQKTTTVMVAVIYYLGFKNSFIKNFYYLTIYE